MTVADTMTVQTTTATRRQRKAMRQLRAPKMFGSIVFLSLVALVAIFGPSLGPDPNLINPDLSAVAPHWLTHLLGTETPLINPTGHWFGTDDLGRDLFTRVAIGARISLLIGLATAVVAMLIGTVYGTISAWFEGNVDAVMMRIIDVIYSLPGLMIVILFSIFWGRSVFSLVMALALFSWPDTARMIRGQMLALKREEFVEAYHSLGGKALRLAKDHFIPNLMGLIVLTTTITVPRAILTESTLSFIGLGVEPPLSSWGTLASDGWQLVRVAPHMMLFPALFIFTTMVALNLLGDALKDLYDPKSSN